MHVRQAKPQISQGISPVWSESSLCAQWEAKKPTFLHADSEDSDQTGRMPGLICVFAGSTGDFVCFVMLQLINLSWRTDCWSTKHDSRKTYRNGQLWIGCQKVKLFLCNWRTEANEYQNYKIHKLQESDSRPTFIVVPLNARMHFWCCSSQIMC